MHRSNQPPHAAALRRPRPRNAAIFLVIAGLLATIPARAGGPPPLAQASILTAKGTARYQLEVAANEQARARGLMWRSELPARGGMVFLFPDNAPRSFWMRNTFIPLDLLFVADDGRIVAIQPQATPKSDAPIESGAPAVAVIELAGGQAAKDEIRVGDRVRLALPPGTAAQ